MGTLLHLFGVRAVYRRVRRRRRVASVASKRAHAEHKGTALAIVRERIEHFNQTYGFTIGTIKIKNQTTRWGSCSKKGNLNFNYKIALLPAELQDYLIVHELCHIGEFNHSKAFWQLVSKSIPHYVERRKELRAVRLR